MCVSSFSATYGSRADLTAVKSFLSYEDASAFAAGRNPTSATSDNKPPRFYGVAVGRQPGVYTEWSAAQEAIVGWKGPKFKKFDTRAEAEAFVRSYDAAAKSTKVAVAEVDSDEADGVEEPSAKKAKTASKLANARNGVLVIYTDGSSRGNGRVGATAGVGVYFGAGDPRFVTSFRYWPAAGMC
jgi:ribonuclease HI